MQAFWVLVVAIIAPLLYHISTGRAVDTVLNQLGAWQPPNNCILSTLPSLRCEGAYVRRNWEGVVVFTPREVYYPRSVQDVQHLVTRARETKRRLKVVGAGHSWGDAAIPDDVMVSLDKYSALVSVSTEQRTITVQAGMRLHKLVDLLTDAGLALPNLPSVDEQSVAGLLATATHGTGMENTNMAVWVEALEMVAGTGELLRVTRTDNATLLEATAVHLGALGIVTQVTLRCVPDYRMQEETAQVDTQLVFGSQDTLNRVVHNSSNYFKVWYHPIHTSRVQVYKGRRVPLATPLQVPWHTMLYITVSTAIFELPQWVAAHVPQWAPAIMRFLFENIGVVTPYERTDVARHVLHVQTRVAPHHESELSVPFEHTVAILDEFHAALAAHLGPHRSINHLVEVRFVKQDRLWLSPDYGRDSCRITLMLYHATDEARREYFRLFEEVARPYLARPHWGKWFYYDRAYLASAFPKFADFERLRHQMDPDRVFDNVFLRRVFG